MALLEHAIGLEHKELKLRHSILKEQIDFVDQSKRLVIPDVLRYVVVPLFYAYGLFRLLGCSGSKKGLLQVVGTSMTKATDLHFWIVVVGAPLLLNLAKGLQRRTKGIHPWDEIPDELKNIDPVSAEIRMIPFLYDYEDPRSSCDDTVSFLVEYWTSVVNGLAIVSACRVLATNGLGITGFLQSNNGAMLWLSCAQFLARLAVVASVYQYPEKLYDLERSELNGPVGLFPTVMLKLVRWMMVFAPLGMIADFSKILLRLPKGWVYPLYASIAVTLLGTWTRMRESIRVDSGDHQKAKDPLEPALLIPPKPLAKLLYAVSFLSLWRKQLQGLRQAFKIFAYQPLRFSPIACWKAIGSGFLVVLSLLGPIIHLKAFSKILKVEHSNNLPSISTKESYDKAVEERPERAYDMAWRHSVRWRKPQRLTVSKGWLYHDFFHWYLFKGTVHERLFNDRADQIRRQVLGNGRSIEERTKQELSDRPEGTLLNGDIDEWKQRAMDFQSLQHATEYANKKFHDPLGVAIHRSFGIGLGFNYEHTTALKDGEEPSPRRLQARFAKSAIQRYNELNDAELALIRKMETLEDSSSEKEQCRIVLNKSKKEFDEEIKYLADKLTELVPTTSKTGEFGVLDTSKFTTKNTPEYRKVSEFEYRKLEEDPLGYDDQDTRTTLV